MKTSDKTAGKRLYIRSTNAERVVMSAQNVMERHAQTTIDDDTKNDAKMIFAHVVFHRILV